MRKQGALPEGRVLAICSLLLPPRVSNCARQSRVPGKEQEGQGKGSGGQADGAEAGLVFKKVQLHTGHMTDDLRAIQVTMTKERGGLLV